MSNPTARDLRGQTLRGADLRGADLQGADLRGVDLTGADLREADLRGARTGLGTKSVVVQTGVAVVVALVGGFVTSWMGEWIRRAVQSPDVGMQIGGVILAAEFVICLVAMAWRGTWFTMRRVLPPTTALLLLTALGLTIVRGSVHGSGYLILLLVLLFTVIVSAVVLARAMASAVHRLAAVAVLAAWIVGASGATGRGAVILVAIATLIAGTRAAAGSDTSPGLSRWAVRMATWGGTSLRGADLRGAKMTDARIRCTDLRGARFEGVDWSAAREIDFCRFAPGEAAPPRKKLSRSKPARPGGLAHARGA